MFPIMDPEMLFFGEFLFPDRSFCFYPFNSFTEGREEFGPVGGCDHNVNNVLSGFY